MMIDARGSKTPCDETLPFSTQTFQNIINESTAMRLMSQSRIVPQIGAYKIVSVCG
jgi:hypothetical protein